MLTMESLEIFDNEIRRLHLKLIATFDDLALLIHEARMLDIEADKLSRATVVDVVQARCSGPTMPQQTDLSFSQDPIGPLYQYSSTPVASSLCRKRKTPDGETSAAEISYERSIKEGIDKEEMEQNWEKIFVEPDFKLRQPGNVYDLWNEWVEGTPARPSVVWLDKRFGRRAWAGAAGDMDEATRRHLLIREINFWVEKKSQPLEKVLNATQEVANDMGGLEFLLTAIKRRKCRAGSFLELA